jgi:hypothetical protein
VPSRSQPSDTELGSRLDELAVHLDLPARPDLAAAVRRRLEAESAVGRPVGRWDGAQKAWGTPRLARLAAAGLAVVVLVSALLTFSPATRRAVAGWLGLRGVRIEQRDAPPPSVGVRLDLGERVSRRVANNRVGFNLLALPEARFGPPDAVYVKRTPNGGLATLLYTPQAGRPAAAPGIGMLLTEFRAAVSDDYVRKLVGNGARIEAVTVDGERGYWLEGAPHVMVFADENGRFFEDQARLAGNTLIWERGPLTLRLESALSRDEAIRLAASL